MSTLKKITLVADGCPKGGAALAVLDRLAGGYPRDGVFRERLAPEVHAHALAGSGEELNRRKTDLGITEVGDLPQAVAGADGVILVPGDGAMALSFSTTEAVLRSLPPGAGCYAVGLIAERAEEAEKILDLAAERRIRLTWGSLLMWTFRLPENGLESKGRSREALIVVQGDDARALADGLFGLASELNPTPEGDGAVVRYRNDAVWKANALGEWDWDLLSAALSRSSNAQGSAVADGRTQDLVGLGMVQRLAERPRAWITRHAGGGHSTLLALDGVVKDVNVATRDRGGVVRSARLYRPPAPNEAGYHRLAARIEDALAGVTPEWKREKTIGMVAWWERLKRA